MEAVEGIGAVPYIPFKARTAGEGKKSRRSEVWTRLYHFFQFNKEEFPEDAAADLTALLLDHLRGGS